MAWIGLIRLLGECRSGGCWHGEGCFESVSPYRPRGGRSVYSQQFHFSCHPRVMKMAINIDATFGRKVALARHVGTTKRRQMMMTHGPQPGRKQKQTKTHTACQLVSRQAVKRDKEALLRTHTQGSGPTNKRLVRLIVSSSAHASSGGRCQVLPPPPRFRCRGGSASASQPPRGPQLPGRGAA